MIVRMRDAARWRSELKAGEETLEVGIMHCYVCAEHDVERPAVALCRSCSAGLCVEHLRETAARFASDHVLAPCHHDTWTAISTAVSRRSLGVESRLTRHP